MLNKKLTICIPTYNRKKVVCELVNFIIESELLLKVDLLVVDDGSSDGTFNALNKIECLGASNIRFIFHENRGFTLTSLSFFSECKTEYLMLADDDMIIFAEGMEKLLDFLNEARPDFVSPIFHASDATSIFRGKKNFKKINIEEFRQATDHGPGLVYRTEVFQPIANKMIDSVLLQRSGVDENFPMLVLLMHASLQSENFWWLPVGTCGFRTTGAEPSGLKNKQGEAYSFVVPRWYEQKGLAALYSSFIEKTTLSSKKQGYQKMLTLHNHSVFMQLRNAVASEAPDLLSLFDGGSVFYNIRFFSSKINAFFVYAKVRWFSKKVFADE